jgi:hypothetical protein
MAMITSQMQTLEPALQFPDMSVLNNSQGFYEHIDYRAFRNYIATGIVPPTIGHSPLMVNKHGVRCHHPISIPRFPLQSPVEVVAMRTKIVLGVMHTQALLIEKSPTSILVFHKSAPPAEHGKKSYYCHTFSHSLSSSLEMHSEI